MSNIPYSSVVVNLMYVMVFTREDIAHAVGVVRKYMNNPGKEHWEVVKWILMYLRGTVTHALCFGVHTLFYKDMLIHIWQVIKIERGEPQVMFLL
jgi:hypothetical protein